MRWSAGIIVCFLFLCTCVQAQRPRYGSIKGTVIDSLSRGSVESSSVTVYLSKDSSLVNYALTTRKGEFTVTDIPLSTPCFLVITNRGYEPFTRALNLAPDTKVQLLDTILLVKVFNELKAVTVTALRPPVSVKPDTLEFNVASFKTMPNAMIEDLIKLLPGAEVDRDGNVTINGKKVTKLMVDGREFFGGDPRVALKNLPKDVIDKLQVVDNKSREARFNKRNDGNEDLAINLTLRKEAQKGWFGNLSAGYGTDERYEGSGMINFFNGSKQFSVIGNVNNTNRGSISGGDFNISTSSSTLDGGGGGLTRAGSGGLNFSNNIGSQIKLNGSYFYNNSHSENLSKSQRQNILPDTTFFYNSDNNNIYNGGNHRLSLNADYNIDTLTEIHISTNLNASQNDGVNSKLANSKSESGKVINTSENTYSTKDDGKNINTEFFISHRFHKPGRGITFGLNYSYNGQSSLSDNIGQNDYYKLGLIDSTDLVNQRSNGKNTGKVLTFSATYSEPLNKYVNLIIRYNYSLNNNFSDKVTHRFDTTTGKYDLEDAAFTNAFRNTNISQTPDASFTLSKGKYNAAIGAGLQFLTQDNLTITTGELLHQNYMNFTPTANMGFNFSKNGSVNIYYNGRSQQPSIYQLQPVPDNSNPLYVQLGNPDLRPSFFHNINLQVRESNGNNYWFTGLGFNTTQNQVITQTWFDDVGKQYSQPLNVQGNYGMSGNVQYSRTWKQRELMLRMNLGTNGYYNRNNTFSNKEFVNSNSYSVSQSLGLTFTYKQVLSIMPTFNIRYNKTRYSIQSIQDASFNTKTLSLSAFWNQPKWLILENNLQYNYNSQIAPGFNKSVTMWSAAANVLLFKKQQAMLRLAVYDILKQNVGVSRSISQTFIEDHQSQVLQQYFLLSFIYNLRKFGTK
ncbi:MULTISPECIES: outer membrane beta-barrel protein [Niastella]|uniref:Outer membrane beta-barrel protein n=1 Tax=Niastella soli TaxID=2821487 RepID=A0ABS3YQ39_9BACT|nr:outer membrane beta-barrel protein [Niastella soli]MBO9199959.1 outer membrane beta-barrel protein [Niastella soli]